MTLMKCNREMRVGDYVSDYEYIVGFVGIDDENVVVTETCEMYDDAKCKPYVVDVRAVVKDREN